MLKRKKIISTLLATTVIASNFAAVDALQPRSSVSETTLAGKDRYKTAIEVSKNGWTKSNNAVIINGLDGLVDALTATPYAVLKDAPILLTSKEKLNADTAAELARLGVKHVDIIGGTSAVSDSVKKEIEAKGITVNRISGKDRYGTSLAVAEAMDKIKDVSKIAVVNGLTGLPDAVSVAAPAGDENMPIILSHPSRGIADSKAFLDKEGITKSYVIGATSAVSDAVKNSLYGTKVRLGGKTRHETNALVIDEFYSNSTMDNIYVAKSGMAKSHELVDALAVGALASKNNDPVNALVIDEFYSNSTMDNIYVAKSGMAKSHELVDALAVGALASKNNDPVIIVSSSLDSKQTEMDNIYVAKSGMAKSHELVDALAVGALASKNNDPVIIVSSSLDSKQTEVLKGKKIQKITKVGEGISSSAINDIKNTQVVAEAKATSIKATDSKTIEITGTNLNLITKYDISMIDNTVSTYTVSSNNTKATIVFNNAFVEGNNSITINSNLGNKTTHNFTYTKPTVPVTEVTSVEATTSEVAAIMNGVQYLEFTVNNGQKKSVDELKAMGYSVKFMSKNDIFYKLDGNTSTETVDGVIMHVSNYGKLKPQLSKGTYTYQIVITKDKKEIKSVTKAFNALEDNREYKEIKNELQLDDNIATSGDKDVVLTSNKLVIGETATIANVKAVDHNNKEYEGLPFTIESSDESILMIKPGNKIEAKSTGTAKITIKVGKNTKEFSIEVKGGSDAIRKVKTVSLSKSSIKLLADSLGDTSITATIKDQYGDPIKGKTLVVEDAKLTISNVVNTIATATMSPSDEKGESTVTINPLKAGNNAKLNIKETPTSTTNLNSITISVEPSSNKVVKTRKLEVNDNKDTNLDVYSANKDKEITMKLNNYNANDYYISQETSLDTTVYEDKEQPQVDNGRSKIWLKRSNKDIVDVTIASNKDINIKAKKAGSVTIYIYESKKDANGKLTTTSLATKSISVKDTTPKITSIYKYPNTDITEAEEIDVINRLLNNTKIKDGYDRTKVDGVTLSGTAGEVLLGKKGNKWILFIDSAEGSNKNGSYDGPTLPGVAPAFEGELVLATIEIELTSKLISEGCVLGSNGRTIDLKPAKTNGVEGQIIVSMYHGDKELHENPFDKTIINVNIEK